MALKTPRVRPCLAAPRGVSSDLRPLQKLTRGRFFSGPSFSCWSILSCCPRWFHFESRLALSRCPSWPDRSSDPQWLALHPSWAQCRLSPPPYHSGNSPSRVARLDPVAPQDSLRFPPPEPHSPTRP